MAGDISQVGLDRSVLIFGPFSLQNKLLAKLIGERTGYHCEVRPAERANGHRAGATLVLLDAVEGSARVREVCAAGVYANIAVINADASLGWDEVVGYPGVKGVFCSDVSEEHLLKGIETIFNGEYWLSRKLLCAHLDRTRVRCDATDTPLPMVLTRKEMQTLRLLATGSTTDDIAQVLKVSPHTVKTHIYNLFRKIRVSNRVQAVHWAARNMVLTDLRAAP